MKKLMYVIHGLSTGGAETLIKDYALKIDKKNFEVIVLCFEHYEDSPYEKFLNDNGIKVIYISDYMKFYGRKSIFYKIVNRVQFKFYLRKFIHNEKPNILHTNLKINTYIKFARPAKDTKIFYTVHAVPSSFWPNKFDRDYRAAKWLVKKYAMRFIVLHEEMRKEVNRMFKVSNSVVLNNGIDFEKFDNAISKSESRKKLNISDKFFVIGHIGRLSKVKNHMFLIEVFRGIYQRNHNAFLILVGDGPEKQAIKFRLNEIGLKERYMILSNRSDIPDILSAMDAFVFPSIYEGLGIALIEAQKMKLPCFKSENVPDYAVISNLVTSLSLEDGPSLWANEILDYKYPKEVILNDKDWDMKEVVKKLSELYEAE